MIILYNVFWLYSPFPHFLQEPPLVPYPPNTVLFFFFFLKNNLPISPIHTAIVSGLNLQKFGHADATTMNSYVQLLCGVQRTIFPCSDPRPVSLLLFLPPLPQQSPNLGRRDTKQMFYLGLRISQYLIPLTSTTCGSLVNTLLQIKLL